MLLEDLVAIRGLLRYQSFRQCQQNDKVKTARYANTERSYIHPKMHVYFSQLYCIIFGNTRQRNIFSLGVIFIHF